MLLLISHKQILNIIIGRPEEREEAARARRG